MLAAKASTTANGLTNDLLSYLWLLVVDVLQIIVVVLVVVVAAVSIACCR